MRVLDTVGHVTAPQVLHCGHNLLDLVQAVDGGCQHGDQLLLLSRHVGGEQRLDLRRDLEEPSIDECGGLRRDGRMHPAEPFALASEARDGGAPVLASTLESAATAGQGPTRRDAAAWAEAFGRCLAAWGWPGPPEALESTDWQAARRFGELLRELANLSGLASPLTVGQALAQLRELAAAPFQPEGGEPAVFVLDRWDDPGLGFDSLWVAGLTSAVWPRPVRIDPFLPIDVQRRLGMPFATAQGCIREAEAVVEAFGGRYLLDDRGNPLPINPDGGEPVGGSDVGGRPGRPQHRGAPPARHPAQHGRAEPAAPPHLHGEQGHGAVVVGHHGPGVPPVDPGLDLRGAVVAGEPGDAAGGVDHGHDR